MTARQLAHSVLERCEKQKQYSNLALDAALKKENLDPKERGLATALVYGVLEKKLTLDYQIQKLSSRPLEEITPAALTALRMGLYQLAFLERIPNHAAVSESVELAGKRAGGFVNAILRGFLRNGRRLLYPENTASADYLSVRYSVGLPLCQKYLSALGWEETQRMLAAMEEHPPVALRTNTLKTTREALIQALTAEGYQAEPSVRAPHGVLLRGNAPVTALPGFAEGHFFVQDEASQLCVEALEVFPDALALDTCACPGSKSFGIAINMENCGSLISCDLHASKLALVRDGAARLGISMLEVRERDARHPCEAWQERFHRILCDVPCSGFGVLAKKPELRYKDPSVSEGLPNIQREILRRSLSFLAHGGRLVYSTCTVLPEENEKVVEDVLRECGDVTLLSAQTYYPHVHGTDGFFVAVLTRA
ncbi:MAG: 16S rRNA (cytosine(967)-C(5))-methyltransferase RsmB [Ruminococcaceae bacterium]|nr:16S rRNA (cytosine(967)-C(5))-methyltransferase RsmB [Oscillospiraceae bacterium]